MEIVKKSRKNESYSESKSSESDFSNKDSNIQEVAIKKKGGVHLRIQKGNMAGHRDFIIKEMTLPTTNKNVEDNAYFNLLHVEYNNCLYIEQLRKQSHINKMLLHGIIKTYINKTHLQITPTTKSYRIQQEYGGEMTVTDFLNQMDDMALSPRDRMKIKHFIYFQCLCNIKSLHFFGIVHNDIHLDNILIKPRENIMGVVNKIKQVVQRLLSIQQRHLGHEQTMECLYKYSPFVIHIFDFDRSPNIHQPAMAVILRHNLQTITESKDETLSTQIFLPQNDIITLACYFQDAGLKLNMVNIIKQFKKLYPKSFYTWARITIGICKRFTNMEEISMDHAMDEMYDLFSSWV